MNETISIPADKIPIHRENLRNMYLSVYGIWAVSMSPECVSPPLILRLYAATHEELLQWNNDFNAWRETLSAEDQRALARGLVMIGAV